MLFILWTAVWYGLVELEWQRLYRYRSVEFLKENWVAMLLNIAVNFVLYIGLYTLFVEVK